MPLSVFTETDEPDVSELLEKRLFILVMSAPRVYVPEGIVIVTSFASVLVYNPFTVDNAFI